jgi:hypothetical protein
MRDTLLLVGNGIALDYRSHSPGMPHPSRPLDYPLSTPGIDGQPLREVFSELWRELDALRASEPDTGDFQLIERLRQMPRLDVYASPPGTPAWREQHREILARALVESQLRLHLTHAYTHFTKMIDDAELRTWRWYSWLLENKERLHTVVSFNYDLLLEYALRAAVPVRYLIQGGGVFGMNREVIVFKPHGSIDFEFAQNMIHGLDPLTLYASKNVFHLVDVPLQVLNDGELSRQRLNSDIVLPTEASGIRRFRYIVPGFQYLKWVRSDITRCVIIGLSYWNCDQPEIDEILGNLRPDVHVIICNPDPLRELRQRWAARFQRFEWIAADVPP